MVLSREQHPEGHEQTYLAFNVRKPPAQGVAVNFEPARKHSATDTRRLRRELADNRDFAGTTDLLLFCP
jgi:hypothetical protein